MDSVFLIDLHHCAIAAKPAEKDTTATSKVSSAKARPGKASKQGKASKKRAPSSSDDDDENEPASEEDEAVSEVEPAQPPQKRRGRGARA